ncbi:hypothetical protein AVEN_226412-1 [Araneus ventricosus]|uniref:Uncharacterized protein n=1 Tax=Araneus ventricosus TaxID=182803 RepID=A0A4Y2H164_ARAVE|nr:hypothetical protein AVEN_226412-1 [Araneus ventricosus]
MVCVKSVGLVRCGSLERGVPDQVSSSPSDSGSKLRAGHSRVLCSAHIKPVIHFTDKLDILEREKEKAIKIYGNPSGLKSARKIRSTLKQAIEKNNALRRLKPRFEGSINKNLLTGKNRRAINKQL